MRDDDDPNEAYEVVPKPATAHGPNGWWTVLMNGIPVVHSGSREKMVAFAASADVRAAYRARMKARRDVTPGRD